MGVVSRAQRALCVALVALVMLGVSGTARAFDIRQVTSPGGINAWLVEDHTLPIVAMNVAFRGSGAITDPEGAVGRANMVSGLLDEGAGEIGSQEFQQRLADKSISLSFDASLDNFSGSLKTLTRNRDEAFEMMRLALNEPRFDAEPVERIRAQILAGLASRANDPGYLASRAFWSTVFPDHPYGRPSDGTPESVAGIATEDLRRFVAERLARENLVIGVVGDVTAEELAPLLDRTFGDLPAEAAPLDVPYRNPTTPGGVTVIDQAIPQSRIVFGQRGIDRGDPDFYAALVLNQIVGGGSFTSRLYDEVREKRGLAYSVYSYLAPLDHGAVWMGGAGTENASAAQTVAIVREQWRQILQDNVGAEELAAAKDNLIGSYALRFDSTSSIAGMLVAVQMEDLGMDYIDNRPDLIGAVTLEDTRRVAERLMEPESLTFVVVGQPEGLGQADKPAGG